MILLLKAVVLEVEVHWVQAHPQTFWFAENLGKKLKMPPKVAWLQKCRPKFAEKHTNNLFGRHTKKKFLMIFLGETL